MSNTNRTPHVTSRTVSRSGARVGAPFATLRNLRTITTPQSQTNQGYPTADLLSSMNVPGYGGVQAAKLGDGTTFLMEHSDVSWVNGGRVIAVLRAPSTSHLKKGDIVATRPYVGAPSGGGAFGGA